MEPITSTLLVFAATAAIKTAKPNWEPKFSETPNSTEFISLEPKSKATAKVPCTSTVGNYLHGFDSNSLTKTVNKSYVVNPIPLPSLHSKVIQELERYAKLPDNWDGAGAVALSPEVKKDAVTFLSKYPTNIQMLSPMLTPEGDLSFYYNSDSVYIDLQFEGGGMVALYLHDRISGKDTFSPSIELSAISNDWFDKTFGVMFVSKTKVA